MSGGISAIRGFDYQSTVILDLLFDHFDHHGPGASVRPEGDDDLDLRWTEAGTTRRRFVQIKKPTEDAQASPKPSPWTLSDVVRDLLPDAIAHLAGNDYEQIWILGDAVVAAVRELFDAGSEAPRMTTNSYWTVIHTLARAEAKNLTAAGSALAQAASQWRTSDSLSAVPTLALRALVADANTFGQLHGPEGAIFAQRYAQEAARLHILLPGAYGRIEIVDGNGSEKDVEERVMQRLEQRYGLSRPVVERTLFRNLRGFINDIAKQPGRSFQHEELELELRSVWPQMVPIKVPPPLADDHIRRPAVVDGISDDWTGVAVEVVGISGSGKTRLAAEVIERSRLVHPNRIVLYAEVRADVSLRDCLVGTAFHLRRVGLSEPFAVAVEPGQANEVVLTNLAAAFAKMPGECLLLLDLVEGREPLGLARDLATFIGAMSSNTLRLIIFGQESTLREITPAERTQFGARYFEAPGLNFEQFIALVGLRHDEPDRGRLGSIYQLITAGRSTGLNVSLAQALARAQTIDEMEAVAARPAKVRLAFAERTRFTRVSVSAHAAAEKLICFALPFQRSEAEVVFLGDNVGLAIRELIDLGLLRQNDGESFEMHETVRAGLEELIARQTRRDAHTALAAWYKDSSQIGAAIFHLEKAGRSQEAQNQARAAFLTGTSWTALWPYVVRHRCISAREVIAVIAGLEPITDGYLLPEILKELDGPPYTDSLMDLIRAQSARVLTDPQWARPILAAILESEPTRIDDLIELMIEAGSTPEVGANALTWLSIAMHRWNGEIGPSTLALFDRQPEAIQKALLGLLLRGGCAALRHTFQHLCKHPELTESNRRGQLMLALNVRTSEEIADILVALPSATPADMIRSRSPRFGPLSGLIWGARKALRTPCIAALEAQVLDSDALVNAIRILLFLGERTILDLSEGLRSRTDMAGALANLVPAIIPALVDWRPYESRVLNQSATFSERAQALSTLAWSGTRLDNLLDRLRVADSAHWPLWTPILLTIASVTPFSAAIPILGEALGYEDDRGFLLPTIIAQQGKMPGPDVTSVLLKSLHHRSVRVRQSAANALARRRDCAALPQLIERYGEEEVPEVQPILATAILASGATSADSLATRSGTPASDLWWCVLAHRTRDLSAADRLVSISLDRTQLWSVRRAAIAAAGRLPYEAALAQIEPSVMAERSSPTRGGPPLPTDLATAAPDQLVNIIHKPLLQAAVLRALRQCGRPDRIEANLATIDHEWVAIKALLERSKLPGRGPVLGRRLRGLIAEATWADDRIVEILLSQLEAAPPTTPSSHLATMHIAVPPPLSTNPPLTYKAAVLALSGGASTPVPTGPLILEPLTSEECANLIGLANPAKDPERGETVFNPTVSFTRNGHRVSQRVTTHRGESFLPDRLRPAIAAANMFGIPIPWHTVLLEGPLGETYASDFLSCLAARGDDARFYAALAEAEETLMPVLCQKSQVISTQLKIDGRLIPTLSRFLAVGGDDVFEGLCVLANCIDIPEILPILEGLLHRWIQRFDAKATGPQNEESVSLWRGFARLTEHPRFAAIPGWPQELEVVLMTSISPHRAQSIVRVMERDPRSYVVIEARLFKESDWEHYEVNEVDRLDRAAEALFSQTQDSRAAESSQ